MRKGFLEVHTQNRLSILAACEDPFNVATYDYAGQRWPLPQTGQMWLEHELLTRPDSQGFFCVSTSYRQEPNAIPGRHDIIFPMFEFEMPGTIHDLKAMEYDLCQHLGFTQPVEKTYEEWQTFYGETNVTELDADHEKRMNKTFGPCMITEFPEFTSPFWNMKRNDEGTANKIDVIISGHETFGSAERETDKEKMRECFNTIMHGKYRDKLYELFGKERTDKELDEYLEFNFFERCGGGLSLIHI